MDKNTCVVSDDLTKVQLEGVDLMPETPPSTPLSTPIVTRRKSFDETIPGVSVSSVSTASKPPSRSLRKKMAFNNGVLALKARNSSLLCP